MKLVLTIVLFALFATGCNDDDDSFIANANSENITDYSCSSDEPESSESKTSSSSSSSSSKTSSSSQSSSSISSSSSQDNQSSETPKSSSSNTTESSSSKKASSSSSYKANINPNFSYGEYTDPRDGHTYRTTVIGRRKWMSQNLNFTTDSSECYKHQENACEPLGQTYSWREAHSICPEGWHLPSRDEFLDLIMMSYGEDQFWIGHIVSGASNFDLNENGFSPTYAGYHFEEEFNNLGKTCEYWAADSTIKDTVVMAHYFCLGSSICSTPLQERLPKRYRSYVRCVNDTLQPFGYLGEYGTLFDERDNIEYRTVVVGKQTWMADDLHHGNSLNYTNEQMKGCDTLCPNGWHMPTKQEWKDLIDFIDSEDKFPEAVKSVDKWFTGFYGTDKYGLDIKPHNDSSKATYWIYWPKDKQSNYYPNYFEISRPFYSRKIGYEFDFNYLDSYSSPHHIRCLKNEDE